MKTTACVGALVAAATLLPTSARAQSPLVDTVARTSPVRATSCRIASDLMSKDVDHPSEPVAGQLWLSLTNLSPHSANEVTLRVKYGTLVETLVERGIFSPGVRVDRVSSVLADSPWIGAKVDDCTVVSVMFADGTAWVPSDDGGRTSV